MAKTSSTRSKCRPAGGSNRPGAGRHDRVLPAQRRSSGGPGSARPVPYVATAGRRPRTISASPAFSSLLWLGAAGPVQPQRCSTCRLSMRMRSLGRLGSPQTAYDSLSVSSPHRRHWQPPGRAGFLGLSTPSDPAPAPWSAAPLPVAWGRSWSGARCQVIRCQGLRHASAAAVGLASAYRVSECSEDLALDIVRRAAGEGPAPAGSCDRFCWPG